MRNLSDDTDTSQITRVHSYLFEPSVRDKVIRTVAASAETVSFLVCFVLLEDRTKSCNPLGNFSLLVKASLIVESFTT